MAKPRSKAYRLADTNGLYVEIAPNGSRYWRLKYRFGGKEKRFALGVYPIVSLAKARDDAREARRLLNDGIDPSVRKKERLREAKLAKTNSFEAVAREWHGIMRPKWTPHHAKNVIESLEQAMTATNSPRRNRSSGTPERDKNATWRQAQASMSIISY